MSLEDFQLKDNEAIDNSINERDFLNVYRQHGANLNASDQNVSFIFVETIYYHHFGNAYLEVDITVQNPAANFDNNSEVRIINNAFAYCFKEAYQRRVAQTLNITTMCDKYLLL